MLRGDVAVVFQKDAQKDAAWFRKEKKVHGVQQPLFEPPRRWFG
jgi:hypothetical protein